MTTIESLLYNINFVLYSSLSCYNHLPLAQCDKTEWNCWYFHISGNACNICIMEWILKRSGGLENQCQTRKKRKRNCIDFWVAHLPSWCSQEIDHPMMSKLVQRCHFRSDHKCLSRLCSLWTCWNAKAAITSTNKGIIFLLAGTELHYRKLQV